MGVGGGGYIAHLKSTATVVEKDYSEVTIVFDEASLIDVKINPNILVKY